MRRLQRRARSAQLPAWRAWCFYAGLATIGLALLSPLAAYSGLLFFIHMIEHTLLMVVAPLLLLLGAPLLPLLWALPRPVRRELGLRFAPRGVLHRIFHLLTAPVVTLSIYVVVVAVWHLPALYDRAQGRTVVHEVEHLLFLSAGLLFWWPVVHPSGGKRRLGDAFTSLYLLVAALEGGLISGALLALSRPIYATYRDAPRVWGISALADQELGAMMMMLGDAIFIFAALWLFIKYVIDEDRETRTLEAAARAAGAQGVTGRPEGD